jgi:MFS family permease
MDHASATTSRPDRRLGGRFWRLWTAVTVSSWGDGLEVAALPLLAASLSEDPLLVAGVVTAATLPWLVFGLVAGAVVDRRDRRRLMWQVNAVRTALAAAVAVLVATGQMHILALYVLVFALGVGQTLYDTASQAILPDLVAPDQLATANARRQVGEMAGLTFLGPPAGGLLFAVAAPVPFALDAATFAVAGGLVASIPGDYGPRRDMPAAPRRTLRRDIAEGARWLVGHPLLRQLVVVLALANLAVFMGEGIFVLFATKELNVSSPASGCCSPGWRSGACWAASSETGWPPPSGRRAASPSSWPCSQPATFSWECCRCRWLSGWSSVASRSPRRCGTS